MKKLIFALLFCITEFCFAQTQGIIPAFEMFPHRTPNGAFVYGNQDTPGEACRISITPGQQWDCGYSYRGSDPVYVCQQAFISAGLPAMFAGAYLVDNGNGTYTCTSTNYPGNLCNVHSVTSGPPPQLYYHPPGVASDPHPENVGYCVNENDIRVFNIDAMKIYVCPPGWTQSVVSGNHVCSGSCPAGQQINIDTRKCDSLRLYQQARNNNNVNWLSKFANTIQSVINYNKTIP